MKKRFYIIWIIVTVLVSCKDKDVNVFDKTADERVAEAINNLKQELIAPPQGWKVKYKPEPGSGSFYVLMKFEEDGKVRIKTDLSSNNGEFFDKTITYRIDNSLGLELILENYSFFSFLFEQDQATFGAEFEFIYVNKTPDNALVFKSKTDSSNPTILTFQEASTNDQTNLLGITLADNLNILSKDLKKITSSLTLTYQDKDVVFYISLDEAKRVLNINSSSKKTNSAITQAVSFSTGYLIKKDSMIFDTPLAGTFLSTPISIKSIMFTTLASSQINVCASPIPTHKLEGITSANQVVTLESSLIDVSGEDFINVSDVYFSPLDFIINDNRVSASSSIKDDIKGAVEFDLYYNYPLSDGTKLFAIGFVIQNNDQSITYALREFTPVLTDNRLAFNFKPGFRIFGNPTTDADVNNINIYLDALSQGDQTYVFKLIENRYEFFNPCTGWSFVLINGNQ